MLCPICRVEMRIVSVREEAESVTTTYACRNKRCEDYGEEIERKESVH